VWPTLLVEPLVGSTITRQVSQASTAFTAPPSHHRNIYVGISLMQICSAPLPRSVAELLAEPHQQPAAHLALQWSTQAPLGAPSSVPSAAASIASNATAESAGGRGRARIMAKFLPRLKVASYDLLDHLRDVETITDPESREVWDDGRESYQEIFEAARHIFIPKPDGSLAAESLPADINYTVSTTRHLYDAYAASQIVAMSNLVFLLDAAADAHIGDKVSLLQTLDRVFPEHCIPKFADGQQDLPQNEERRIVSVVLDIRTMLLYHRLEKRKADDGRPFHPFDTVLDMFFDSGATVDEVRAVRDDVHFQSHHLKPIGGIDIRADPTMSHQVLARIRTLLTYLEDKIADASELDASGILDIVNLDDAIQAFHDLVTVWFDDIKNKLETHSLEYQIHPQIGSMGARPAVGIDGALKILQDLEKERDAGRLVHDDILARSRQLESSAQQPQPSAYPFAVSYPDLDYDQRSGDIYAASAAQATGRKRRPPAGGESGQPPVKKQRGRRKQAAAAPQLPAAPLTDEIDLGEGSSQYPPPPSSAPPPAVEMMEPDFEAVQRRTREIAAANRKPREPQQRLAWVKADQRQLVKAVHIYKCKWSLMETEIRTGVIPFEIPRDQQALRDKARLMKQDFLK